MEKTTELINPFQPSVTFDIETSNLIDLEGTSNDWFLHELQHWAEKGESVKILVLELNKARHYFMLICRGQV